MSPGTKTSFFILLILLSTTPVNEDTDFNHHLRELLAVTTKFGEFTPHIFIKQAINSNLLMAVSPVNLN